MVKPILDDTRSPCQGCGREFEHSTNRLDSCVYHSGHYSHEFSGWTCCEATNADARGCKSGPHSGKERAANVRVEALPRSVDGITLYTHFEINIFPSVPHTLVVQITKSLSKLFMAYFFVGKGGNVDNDDMSMSASSDITGLTEDVSLHSSENSTRLTNQRVLLVGNKGSYNSSLKHGRQEGSLTSSRMGSEVDSSSDLEFLGKETPTEKNKETEIIFIKYWRVGYANIQISLGGFRHLPETSLDIRVPAFTKAYKIGSWEYLGRKYLAHLIQEILKSGASSGLDKFRRKVMGGSSTLSPTSEHGGGISPRQFTDLSGSSASESESSGRQLHRPVGAAAILGTPLKPRKGKIRKALFKKK